MKDQDNLYKFFKHQSGSRVFVNGDSRQPYFITQVQADFLTLDASESELEKSNQLYIPFQSIVSIQRLNNVDGLVFYLVK